MKIIVSFILYMISFIISSSLFYYYRKHKKELNSFQKICLFLTIILLPAFIAGYRSGVGTDFYEYKKLFNNIVSQPFCLGTILESYLEPLWSILNYVAYYLLRHVFGLYLITAILFLSFGIRGIDLAIKDHKLATLAVIIFYLTLYPLSLNVMRQALAISILIYAMHFLWDNKNFKFLLMIFIAYMFHKSAIFGLIYFLFYHILNDDKKEKYYLALFLILLPFIPLFCILLKEVMLSLQFKTYYFQTDMNISLGFIGYVIPEICMIIYLYMRYHKTWNTKTRLCWNIILLQIPLQIIGWFIPVLDRFALYTLPARIFIFPLMIGEIQEKESRKKYILFTIAWFIFYFIAMFVVLRGNQVFPYHFIGGIIYE